MLPRTCAADPVMRAISGCPGEEDSGMELRLMQVDRRPSRVEAPLAAQQSVTQDRGFLVQKNHGDYSRHAHL